MPAEPPQHADMPRKGTADDAARTARLAQLREADARGVRRRSRLRTAAMVIGAVAVLGAGATVVVAATGDRDSASPPAPSTASAGPAVDPDKANVRGERLYRDLERQHVTGHVDYGKRPMPPAGGRHNPLWQNADGDVYTRPLKDEHAVHALEHGAVWVTYSSEATAADVAALRKKVEGLPYRMMSPVPDQPSPVELTAWGHQLSLPSADDSRVAEFLRDYVQGPQAPEPGAPVTGGRATP